MLTPAHGVPDASQASGLSSDLVPPALGATWNPTQTGRATESRGARPRAAAVVSGSNDVIGETPAVAVETHSSHSSAGSDLITTPARSASGAAATGPGAT